MDSYRQQCIKRLHNLTVDEVPRPKKLIEIDSNTSLVDGFTTLMAHNIQSAPVFDAEKNQYIGFLDVRDLVSFVVFVYDQQQIEDNSQLAAVIKYGIGQIVSPGTDGVTVRYLAGRNVFKPATSGESLMKVVDILASGSRRVPVVDENGKVVNIISQSTVVSLLSDIETNDTTPISEIDVGTSPVLSVLSNESVINTCRKLDKYKKSGLAIVDSTGRMVGTTTAKDLRLFLSNPTLQSLNMPIMENLRQIRDQDINERNPAIGVFEKDSLQKVVNLLHATRVHRVFVLSDEEHYRPLRVISFTDILRYFVLDL